MPKTKLALKYFRKTFKILPKCADFAQSGHTELYFSLSHRTRINMNRPKHFNLAANVHLEIDPCEVNAGRHLLIWYLTSWSSLIEEDEGYIGPSGKLLCL